MGDPLRLYGLNALVLNGGSGIGEAIARTLLKHGASVVAVDAKNTGVERIFSAIKGIEGIGADLSDADEIAEIVQTAADRMDGVDILINDFPLSCEMPMDASAASLQTLLQSRSALTEAACHAALPYLKKSPAGRIINMGLLRSCFAVDANEACKKAERNLKNLTREMAAKIGKFGVTANYVQPGGVMTPESRGVFRKDGVLRDHCINQSAARRLGEPVDVAKVVLFLASDDAGFVSGTGIAVDGGRKGDWD